MNKIILLLVCFLLKQFCYSQNSLKINCDSTAITSYGYFKGDTIIIECDTVYIMNKQTFSYYQRSYSLMQTKSVKFEELTKKMVEFNSFDENRFKEKTQEFNQLKIYFDSLTNSSKDLVIKTNKNITDINQSLDLMKAKITSANDDIGVAKDEIKSSIRKQWTSKLLFGAGGLSVGLLSSVLLYSVFK